MSLSPILVISFVIAFLVGLIVGIERSYRARTEDALKGAGIRTFILVSVTGFLFSEVFKDDPFTLVIFIGGFSILFFTLGMIRAFEQEPGMTTPVTLLIVFLAGTAVGLGYPFTALFVAVVTLALTSTKGTLHRFADLLSYQEMESAVRFLTVALILLPITYTLGPLHPLIGPGRIFDPMKAVLMILFVSSISFTSYLVMKFFGTGKGMEISAFIGGFVSSAAATASMSEKCKKNPALEMISTVSILLTNSSMFIKDYIIIVTMGGFMLALDFTVPIVVLSGLTVLLFIYMIRSHREKEPKTLELELESPFALKPAVKFAFIFSIIWASSYVLQNQFGSFGVYAVSVGGLISTTSVSASMATMYASGEIGSLTALSTVLLSFALSSISKIFIARSYFKGLGARVAAPMISTSVVTFIMVVLLNL